MAHAESGRPCGGASRPPLGAVCEKQLEPGSAPGTWLWGAGALTAGPMLPSVLGFCVCVSSRILTEPFELEEKGSLWVILDFFHRSNVSKMVISALPYKERKAAQWQECLKCL